MAYLKNIRLLNVDRKPIIDILIGVDYADLNCADMEVKGEPNQPITRLTPLA